MQTAACRLKWQRLRQTLMASACVLAGISYIWVGLALRYEAANSWGPYIVAGSLGAFALALAGSWLLPVRHTAVLRKIDRALRTEDEALAAGELCREQADFWRVQLLKRTVERLRQVSWPAAWPLRWPRFTLLGLFSYVVLTLLSIALFIDYGQRLDRSTTPERVQAALAQMKSSLDTWDEALESVPKEDRQDIRESLEAFEKIGADQAFSEKEAMIALSRIEDRLSQAIERLKQDALAEHADELANALDDLNGLGEAAAAMRKEDFAEAAKALNKARETLKQQDSKPLSDFPDLAASKMSDLSSKLGQKGQQQAAQAMEMMAKATQSGNKEQMAQGMEQLEKASAMQSARKSQTESMQAMMSQVSGMKENISSGMSQMDTQQGMPGQQPGGNDPGTQEHDDPFGRPSELEASREDVKIAGSLGEGQSQITTSKSEQGQASRISTGTAADYGYYEKLSRQAIDDESIPASYRDTIKEYFERIRPREEPSGQ